MSIIFSIIMPTYNSGNTIAYSLESVKNQNFDLSCIECLVIDGGSSDNTVEIAEKYPFVKVIHNKKRLPENAKKIGMENASGSYIIKMDSDEAFKNPDSLALRLKAFSIFKNAHLLVADRLSYIPLSINKGISGNYSNICGDPFTFFIYRNSSSILKTYKKCIKEKTDDGIYLLDFSDSKTRPIADGGTTTVELSGFSREEISDITFACSVSDIILDRDNCCICIEGDEIEHRSKAGFRQYLKKLRFRVINNIFNKEESGFSSRKVNKLYKKYFFPLYTLSFIFPLADSVILALRYRDITMLLHIFYCYYTCILIAVNMLIKILRLERYNSEY